MRRAPIVIALLAGLALSGARAQDAASRARYAELEKAYKEVRKSALWEEIKKRRDLIVLFGDLDHPGSVGVLYEAFTEDREQVCRIPAMIGLGRRGNTKVLKAMTTAAVRDRNEVYVMCLPLAFAEVAADDGIGAWLTKNLLGKGKPPELRPAVLQSLGLLRSSEAFEPVLEILAEGKPDRRTAYESLIALARIGGARAFDVVVPFLESDDRVLREGAVLALGETGHPGAVEKILPLAKDVAPRVQEAVAEVIRARKADEGIPVLIELLRTGRLRVMDTARSALEEISGEKHGLDPSAWERWRERQEKDEPPAEEQDPAGSVATYYGMNVLSDQVLFVVDVSGSMKAGEPTRIETAREELTKTLDQLNRKTLFNIVCFSGQPVWWREQEVEASPKNVADAKKFVEGLDAGGGTNVYDTLVEAFEKNKLVDTIFFLGDGSPSLGTFTEQEEILARLRWINRFRKVRIHAIALLRGEVPRFGGRMGPGLGRGRSVSGERAYDEEEAARFLARMAAEHDGTFLKLDQ